MKNMNDLVDIFSEDQKSFFEKNPGILVALLVIALVVLYLAKSYF